MTSILSRRGLAILATTAGLLLFGLALRSANPASVSEGVRRVGTGFVWIALVAGLRLVVRAAAWCACAGGTSRLSFRSALGACLAGEAAGSLTPLGLAASEPVKVVWVRDRLETVEAAASLAVETLLYSISVAVVLLAGTVILLTRWAPVVARQTLAAVVVASAIAAVLLWRARARPASGASTVLRWLDAPGPRDSVRRPVAAGIRRTGEIFRTLARRRPWTLVSTALLELAFQALSVVEVWVTLALLGVPATFLQAFLMDFANRAVTVAFKFVPLRLGVDEWASAAMAAMLGSGGAAGVTVAVIRKARLLFWSTAGLAAGAWRVMASAAPRRTVAIPAESANSQAS